MCRKTVGLTRTQHARRAQRLPLVCRRWHSVLMGEITAWQTLQLDSRIWSTDGLSSFFAFCSRTRCIEVGGGAHPIRGQRLLALVWQVWRRYVEAWDAVLTTQASLNMQASSGGTVGNTALRFSRRTSRCTRGTGSPIRRRSRCCS